MLFAPLMCGRARALTSDEVQANSFSSAAKISAYKQASGKIFLFKALHVFCRLTDSGP